LWDYGEVVSALWVLVFLNLYNEFHNTGAIELLLEINESVTMKSASNE
jgi:hypothetical protein